MKVLSITVLSLVLTLLLGAQALSQSWKTYYTKDNLRAQNISLSVDYPSEFQLGFESII
jgi:hypothetical protein